MAVVLFNILNVLLCGFIFNLISKDQNKQKIVSLYAFAYALILSAHLICRFDKNIIGYQQTLILAFDSSPRGLNFILSFDAMSTLFIVLSCILMFLCVQKIYTEPNFTLFANYLFLILILLILAFSTTDLFAFYIFFEGILIPMFFMIGIFGSRERRIRADFLLFFYTAGGSALMLVAILYLFVIFGDTSFETLMVNSQLLTFNEQAFIWIAFFIAFASKIPMFPFHIWLPEAHVEAPTAGSVILAGILLKLGVYGFIRCNLMILPEISAYFSPFVYLVSALGIISASFNALRQTDLKRIIAYSSIAHMNLVTLGIFSFSLVGIQGALIQSLSHGFVSGGLFLLVGMLYDRYHTRHLYYYGGLVHFMPLFVTAFLILTLANLALPGTSSFTGEFLLLQGTLLKNNTIGIFATLGVILSGAYSLWLYNRIAFGNLKISYTKKFVDLSFSETLILLPIIFMVLVLGVKISMLNSFISLFSTQVSLIIT